MFIEVKETWSDIEMLKVCTFICKMLQKYYVELDEIEYVAATKKFIEKIKRKKWNEQYEQWFLVLERSHHNSSMFSFESVPGNMCQMPT